MIGSGILASEGDIPLESDESLLFERRGFGVETEAQQRVGFAEETSVVVVRDSLAVLPDEGL